MKPHPPVPPVDAETARRERRKAIRFIARLILQTIQAPKHEKSLVPAIGNENTQDNLAALVFWVSQTWHGPLARPRDVARFLTGRLLVALIDAGP